jgi:hypothetical protein
MNDQNEDRKIDILLEKFKISAQIQDNYNTLFWTRTTVFFAINTALFAGYALAATRILDLNSLPPQAIPVTLMLVIFGVVGALLSALWLRIHRRATFLQDYYRFRASVIEDAIGMEPEIFGKSYRIASTEDTWDKVYGSEWQDKKKEWEELFRKLVGKAWKDQKATDPGSLRKNLDSIYIVFIGVWILLSALGVVILLQILLHPVGNR